MNILWFTWKDRTNPYAGGAELVNEELAKRLVRDGHTVRFVVGGYPGARTEEVIDGYSITRIGSRWTVYLQAYFFYKKNLRGWADLVIDEMNTMPFFTKWYVRERKVLFVHQLCREIWFYQLAFPFSVIGYLVEPIYLWLMNDMNVITVSESTKKDLQRYGFKAENIQIISEGIALEPVRDLTYEKYPEPTMLSLGSVRPMKRTLDIVRAFEIAKGRMPDLRLIIAGDMEGAYGKKVSAVVAASVHANFITCAGKISEEQKKEFMQKAHMLAVTSVKEGWCLVVTEANSQGTPTVVYDVDGLRDSVKNGITGVQSAKNTPESLASALTNLLSSTQEYERMRSAGWEWSKELTFEQCYKDFLAVISQTAS